MPSSPPPLPPSPIRKVVVLMLENRSFDHLLGYLVGPPDGLVGDEQNPDDPAHPTAWHGVSVAHELHADPVRPGHEFLDVAAQLYGTENADYGKTPTLDGFYGRCEKAFPGQGEKAMHAFAANALPSLHALARTFTVCTRWFSSVPGPTWPNRFFAHCGTAGGFLDGKFRSYPMRSVFGALGDAGLGYRIYYHDIPQTLAIDELRGPTLAHRFRQFDRFRDDAAAGALPEYTFIEPNYGILPDHAGAFGGLARLVTGKPNDQHPDHGAALGDALIADVYDALRSSPSWHETLLIVVWDEHGGFYDHVPPPPAVPLPPAPGANPNQYQFAFNRLGVRVPAILISPYAAARRIDTPFEHASLPRTLSELFGIPSLTARDAAAHSVLGALTTTARDDCPLRLPRLTGGSRVALPLPGELSDGAAALVDMAEQLAPQTSDPAVAGVAVSSAQARRTVAVARIRSYLGGTPTAAPASARALPVRADAIDLRDRVYAPSVARRPPASVAPAWAAVRDQQDTEGCTGYALAAVLDVLLSRGGQEATDTEDATESRALPHASPRMLYSMARRYDDLPGEVNDTGATLRAVMKGWFRHGACAYALWPDEVPVGTIPDASTAAREDWWADAVKRPLGAYFRVDASSIADIQNAIAEAGAVLASAVCHAGWEQDLAVEDEGRRRWTIPCQDGGERGAHAFALVGYDDEGFWVHNSWGASWGDQGRARLTYADWLLHGIDCWVAQLGVVTRVGKEIAATTRLRWQQGRLLVARESVLRDHELDPFIVDTENDGQLGTTGRFRTTPADLDLLLGPKLSEFREHHGLAPDAVVDVALYAHGGLMSEDAAGEAAGDLIPRLYENRIFPIFLMWETGPLQTVDDLVEDALRGRVGETSAADRWLDDRLERLVSTPGSALWNEMKRNAAALSAEGGALRLLFAPGRPTLDAAATRLHLIGHSAGSIVHHELLGYLFSLGRSVESVSFLAPALRVERFLETILPAIGKQGVGTGGKGAAGIGRYLQLHLSDALERVDRCGPYSKSLLYLVSRAFEDTPAAPILGMERAFLPALGNAPGDHIAFHAAVCAETTATHHGTFFSDVPSVNTVMRFVRGLR